MGINLLAGYYHVAGIFAGIFAGYSLRQP